jgi:hypothetical protein
MVVRFGGAKVGNYPYPNKALQRIKDADNEGVRILLIQNLPRLAGCSTIYNP